MYFEKRSINVWSGTVQEKTTNSWTVLDRLIICYYGNFGPLGQTLSIFASLRVILTIQRTPTKINVSIAIIVMDIIVPVAREREKSSAVSWNSVWTVFIVGFLPFGWVVWFHYYHHHIDFSPVQLDDKKPQPRLWLQESQWWMVLVFQQRTQELRSQPEISFAFKYHGKLNCG